MTESFSQSQLRESRPCGWRRTRRRSSPSPERRAPTGRRRSPTWRCLGRRDRPRCSCSRLPWAHPFK